MAGRTARAVYRTPAWKQLRRQALDRDGWRCRRCGRAGRLEVHHVKELASGGRNDLSNLETLCRRCHMAATARFNSRYRPDPAWTRLVAQLTEG